MPDDLLYTIGSEIKDPSLTKIMNRLIDNITSDGCAVCYTPSGSGVTLNFDKTATNNDTDSPPLTLNDRPADTDTADTLTDPDPEPVAE